MADGGVSSYDAQALRQAIREELDRSPQAVKLRQQQGTTAGQATSIASIQAQLAALGLVVYLPGDLKPTAKAAADTGFLLCDGSAVSRATFAALFAAIGTTFGVGDGSTTFNVPDFRGRVPVGVGTAAGAAGATAHTLAQKAGEETHVLIASEAPSHNHGGATTGMNVNQSHAHTYPFSVIGTAGTTRAAPDSAGVSHTNTDPTNIDHTHSISTNGSDQAHNNMPPYLGVNWMVKT